MYVVRNTLSNQKESINREKNVQYFEKTNRTTTVIAFQLHIHIHTRTQEVFVAFPTKSRERSRKVPQLSAILISVEQFPILYHLITFFAVFNQRTVNLTRAYTVLLHLCDLIALNDTNNIQCNQQSRFKIHRQRPQAAQRCLKNDINVEKC